MVNFQVPKLTGCLADGGNVAGAVDLLLSAVLDWQSEAKDSKVLLVGKELDVSF
jgi:hypothetical protein